MQKIRPFRATTYNPDYTPGVRFRLGEVVCPPYDVISPKMQGELYRKSPYNFVRLVLGRMRPSDDEANNRYTRARRDMESWLANGILVEEPAEAFYIYSQRYRDNGKTVERVGFVGLMGLDSSSKVLPHENTLAKAKEDRLKLIRQTKANLEPIFVLYDDPGHRIALLLKKHCRATMPVISVKSGGVLHQIHRLDSSAAVSEISRLMAPKEIFIADGHHRYEVSRIYAKETAGRAGWMMVYFVESDERMLTILAAHRLVKDIGALDAAGIKRRLAPHFEMTPFKGLGPLMSRLRRLRESHAFGMYLGKGRFFCLKLKGHAAADRAMKGKPKDWKRLDVSILHFFILRKLLRIRDDDENIEYMKDLKEAKGFIDRRRYKILFLLNPTKVSDVKSVARKGERMPKKATYFYPKPLSGLLVNRLGV